MAVDKSTEVLIVLIAIIVAMVIFLILTIIVLALRWRRYKARNSKITYPFTPATFTSLPHARHSDHLHDPSIYTYVSPDSLFRPIVQSREQTDIHHTPRKGHPHLNASTRISAISGTSVDIGNLPDTSAFVHNPRASPFRHQQTVRDYSGGKVDSMRSSTGVDLGGDYDKAWQMVSTCL